MSVNSYYKEYPLKRNTVFLGRVYHAAMIGKPVAHMKDCVHISDDWSNDYERAKDHYFANRAVWC